MPGWKKNSFTGRVIYIFFIGAPAAVQRYATCEASLPSGPAYAIFNQFIGFLPPHGLSSLSLYFSTRLLGEQIDLNPTHSQHACTAFLPSRTRRCDFFLSYQKKGRHAANFPRRNSLRPAAEWHFSVCGFRFSHTTLCYWPRVNWRGRKRGVCATPTRRSAWWASNSSTWPCTPSGSAKTRSRPKSNALELDPETHGRKEKSHV